MTPLLHDPSLVSAAAVSALFSAIWEGTILAAGAVVGLRMLPRLSAASRSAVWMSVFSLVILLHVVPAFKGAGTGEIPAHALYIDPRWSVAIALLWAALSLWRAAQLISSGVRLQGLAGRATPMAADDALAAILQDGRAAELCVSDEVERPCVFGFFRPRILIPPAVAEKLSALELQQVVLHEMEHLRRRDDWTNLLQKICLAVFPLNPVLLWVERRLCAERELACDDRVLRSNGARKAYALCLTHLAEYSMVRRSLSLVLGAWERQSELVRRVHRLLRAPGESMGGRRAGLITAALMVGVLGGAAGLARSPELVSFARPTALTAQAGEAQPMDLRGVKFARASVSESGMAGQGTHAQMVKAVMPERTGQAAAGGSAQKPLLRTVARRAVKKAPVQNPQAWLVLTDWNESMMPPRIVFAVDPGYRVTYEAVRVPNGWLIVQI